MRGCGKGEGRGGGEREWMDERVWERRGCGVRKDLRGLA